MKTPQMSRMFIITDRNQPNLKMYAPAFQHPHIQITPVSVALMYRILCPNVKDALNLRFVRIAGEQDSVNNPVHIRGVFCLEK